MSEINDNELYEEVTPEQKELLLQRRELIMMLNKRGYELPPGQKETVSSYKGVELKKMTEDTTAPSPNIVIFMDCDANYLELYVFNAGDDEVKGLMESISKGGRFEVMEKSDGNLKNLRQLKVTTRLPETVEVLPQPTPATPPGPENTPVKIGGGYAKKINKILSPLAEGVRRMNGLMKMQKSMIRSAEQRKTPRVNIKRIFDEKSVKIRQD